MFQHSLNLAGVVEGAEAAAAVVEVVEAAVAANNKALAEVAAAELVAVVVEAAAEVVDSLVCHLRRPPKSTCQLSALTTASENQILLQPTR